MTHEEIKDALYAFYDGELSGEMAGEIRGHLPSCADCRAVLEGWKRVSGLLKLKTENPDLVARVMARLEPEERPVSRPWSWRWMAPAFGLGFAALIYSVFPVKQVPEQIIASIGSRAAVEIETADYTMEDLLLEEPATEENGIVNAIEEYFL